MKIFNFSRFFANNSTNASRKKADKQRRGRTCRIEELEGREMLSVTIGQADFDSIKSQYADLDLGAWGSYNIIEVSGTGDASDPNHFAFSDQGLRDAITATESTAASDLIVVRTTTMQNTLQLSGNQLAISNINVATRGSVIIVGYGTMPFTLSLSSNNISVNNATVAFAGLTITGGSANAGGGVNNSGTLTITNSTITGNSATRGGGIFNSGTLNLTNSIIAGNEVSSTHSARGQGGGIFNGSSFGRSTLTIANCVITGNTAKTLNYLDASGGGVYIDYNYNSGGTVTITNTTVAGNFANSGGGIYYNQFYGERTPITINNTVVAMNNVSDITASSGLWSSENLSGSNNLIGVGTGQTTLTHGSNGNIVGSSESAVNPRFVSISPPTTEAGWNKDLWKSWNLRLQSDSPAINQGSNTLAVHAGKTLTTDLAGNQRIVGGIVDIGAYEFAPTPLSPPTLTSSGVTGTCHDTIRVVWGAVSNASGYRVEYATNAAFTTGFGSTTVNASTTSTDITGRSANTTYYVRVIATGTGQYGNSNASSTQSATTKTKLSRPVIGTFETTGATINVTWGAVSNAGSYTVEYATDSAFTAGTDSMTVDASNTSVDIINRDPFTTYYIRVLAVGSGTFCDSDLSTYVTRLGTPGNFREERKTTDSITLTWEGVTGASSYRLEYSPDGEDDWIQIGGTITGTSYLHASLERDTTYYYRISAISGSNVSILSPVLESKTSNTFPLDVPANVSANVNGDEPTTIGVTWECVDNADGYRIFYSTDPNFPEDDAVTKTRDVVVGGAESDSITDLTAGETYFIRVIALGDGTDFSDSLPSKTAWVTILIPPPVELIALEAPDVTLSKNVEAPTTKIDISWLAVPDADSYFVEYYDGTTWQEFTTTEIVATLSGLEPNTTYAVYVTALPADSETHKDSERSEVKFFATEAVEVPPPVELVALETPNVTLSKNADDSTTKIDVAWLAVPDAGSYKVEYYDGVAWQEFTTTEIAATLTGLEPDTTCAVYVTALPADSETHKDSKRSEIKLLATEAVEVPPPVDLNALEAPDVTLSKNADDSTTKMDVSWLAVPDAGSYFVEYYDGTVWQEFTTTEIAATLTGLEPNTTYAVYVTALPADSETHKNSERSAVKLFATEAEDTTSPVLPKSISATVESVSSIALTWPETADAMDYEVQYSLNGGNTWILWTGTAEDATTAAIGNLAANMNYVFRVRAVLSEGMSDWSDIAVAKTNPAESAIAAVKPKKVAVAKNGNKPTVTTITLNVTKNTKNIESGNTASYIVTCISDPMLKFSYSVKGDQIFIEGLNPGTKHTFAVQAIHQNGNVSAAFSVKATTEKYTAVKSLKKTATTTDSVTLSWKPSTAPAQTIGYVIEVYDSTGKILLDTVSITDAGTTTYTIPELSAGTKYTFVVRATDGKHQSLAAKVKVATVK